ncbi:MAG: replication-relaxation family protein [Actinomycetota bacterium]
MSSAQYEREAASELDEVELAVLRALAEHKIFSTYQLMVLFFDSLRTAQKRIKGLKDQGLIETFAWRNRRTQRESDRHFLSARGAALVCRHLGVTRAQLGWIPQDARDAARKMWHISGANAFFCELVEATMQTPDVGVLLWRPEHQIRTKDVWIQPDGLGRLVHAGGMSEFFFEFDRSTENRGPLIAKFARYLRVGAAWPHRRPFPSVLMLVPDSAREEKLPQLLAEAAGHVEPEATVIASRFFSSNLDLIKLAGPLGDGWRPMVGSSRIAITSLPPAYVDIHVDLLPLCLGRRWCGGGSPSKPAEIASIQGQPVVRERLAKLEGIASVESKERPA